MYDHEIVSSVRAVAAGQALRHVWAGHKLQAERKIGKNLQPLPGDDANRDAERAVMLDEKNASQEKSDSFSLHCPECDMGNPSVCEEGKVCCSKCKKGFSPYMCTRFLHDSESANS
jgi:hypothetical protein